MSIQRPNPLHAFLTAVQFLTRIPTPRVPYTDDSLANSLPYFPLVGLLLAYPISLIERALTAHLSTITSALSAILILILITGSLHEDGLADAADAFGSHHPHARTLEILRDSRIGTYGTLALIVSISARVLLLAALPSARVTSTLIAALVLSRWSSLPLALLPPARPESDGQGARVAHQITPLSLTLGTLLALTIIIATLHLQAIVPILSACTITALTAFFYKRRIGGVTGDCFGATSQLVEIAVLLCGAWNVIASNPGAPLL